MSKTFKKVCKIDGETGQVTCDEDDKEVGGSQGTEGELYKNASFVVTSQKCRTNNKTGKYECDMHTESDRRPGDKA
jgi:hypothetical protein